MGSSADDTRTSLLPEHLYELVFVSDPALSPDGRRGIYVRTDIVRRAGDAPPRYRHRLRLVEPDAGSDVALTQGEADRAPRWSPTGHAIAFLAPERAEATKPGAVAQLWVIALGGGEARRLTSFAAGVLHHRWSAAGDTVLVTTRGEWRDDVAADGTGRVVTERLHRGDGIGWVSSAPVELWRVEATDGARTHLWDFDRPPGTLEPTPDGEHVVYLAAERAEESDMGRTRLWSRPLRDGAARDLLGRSGSFTDPSVSPDGRHVALFDPQDPEDWGSPTSLTVVDLESGAYRTLTHDVAASPSVAGDSRIGAHPVAPRWEGARLVVALNRAGRSAIARVDLEGDVTEHMVPGAMHDRVVTAFDARAGRILALIETPTSTGQLHTIDADGSERRLTSWNDALLRAHAGGIPAPARTFDTADGQALTYWRLDPVRPRDDGAMVVQVHGGPYTNYGYGFVFEFHLLASAGYRVIYGNPRGGSSFGAEFARAIKGRYGTVDADDVLAIVDHAVGSVVDDRGATTPSVHLTGGSYGGFMTNWLVAHTDRFRSAVTQRSICNWLSFYGTSDIGPFFTELEQGWAPWDDAEALWDRSPLKYVANVSTPTLVIHAEADHRCPIEQAEQWFTALKRLGRAPTRLLRFPDEGHELSRSGRPDRRVQRLEAIIGWFEEHA